MSHGGMADGGLQDSYKDWDHFIISSSSDAITEEGLASPRGAVGRREGAWRDSAHSDASEASEDDE